MTTTLDPLSPADVLHLADLIKAINHGDKITFFPGLGGAVDGAKTVTGTLRHLTNGKDDANHLTWGTDVRTAWVRITLNTGWDHWVPVAPLAAALASGSARID